jgi:hypothetical protein
LVSRWIRGSIDDGQAGGGLRVKPVVAEAEDRQVGGGLRVRPVEVVPMVGSRWIHGSRRLVTVVCGRVAAFGSSRWLPRMELSSRWWPQGQAGGGVPIMVSRWIRGCLG